MTTTDRDTGTARTTRRGMVAGAAILAAGVLAQQGMNAQHVAAADGDPIKISLTNQTPDAETVLELTGAFPGSFDISAAVFLARSNVLTGNANGLTGFGGGARSGVRGYGGSLGGAGVTGIGGVGSPVGSGVVGIASGATEPAGGQGSAVVGIATGTSHIGLRGETDSGNGVQGTSNSSTGVFGISTSGNGVSARSVSANGVEAQSSTGIGVYGVNTGGGGAPFGVVGAVSTAPGFALYGVVNSAGAVGFAAGAGVSGAIAGQFSGPVNIFNNGVIAPGNLFIQGNYTASGTKSAAVPHPDGSHRLLYCMESPEAWFEDFGEGTITAGKAEVKLDPDFVAVVDMGKLHVFLTEHDEHHALHLTGRTDTGFTVAADSGALAAKGKQLSDANGTFTWRVVAKRKDVKAARFAKYDLPREIKPPPLPPLKGGPAKA